MTNIGTTYNLHSVESCTRTVDTDVMNNLKNTQAALRAAFGPGYQAGGPSDATLRVVAKKPKR